MGAPERAVKPARLLGVDLIQAFGHLRVGEPPFTGATVQTVVAKVLTERPTAPSAVRDTVPAGIEGAVLKALAKLPADRFATAEKFAEALTRTDARSAARLAGRTLADDREVGDLAPIGSGRRR